MQGAEPYLKVFNGTFEEESPFSLITVFLKQDIAVDETVIVNLFIHYSTLF